MSNTKKLFQYFEGFIDLSPESLEAISQVLSFQTFTKKSMLLANEQVCKQIFFIEKGLVREFFYDANEDENTIWFGAENSLAVSLSSFITQKPGFTCIQALEEVEATCIHYEDLQRLYSEYHDIERLGRLITESYFLETEAHQLTFQKLSATQRYELLLKSKPEIFQRVPLKYIASYLKMNMVTLSKIRGKKS